MRKIIEGEALPNGSIVINAPAPGQRAIVNVSDEIAAALYGRQVRVTIEGLNQFERYACDKCKADFMVDATKPLPTCCGNVVPKPVINDPTLPPLGGNWVWDGMAGVTGLWVNIVEQGCAIVESAHLAELADAVRPHVLPGEERMPLLEKAARVIERLTCSPLVAGERARWVDDAGRVHRGEFLGLDDNGYQRLVEDDGMHWLILRHSEHKAVRDRPEPTPPPSPEVTASIAGPGAKCAKHDRAIACRACVEEAAILRELRRPVVQAKEATKKMKDEKSRYPFVLVVGNEETQVNKEGVVVLSGSAEELLGRGNPFGLPHDVTAVSAVVAVSDAPADDREALLGRRQREGIAEDAGFTGGDRLASNPFYFLRETMGIGIGKAVKAELEEDAMRLRGRGAVVADEKSIWPAEGHPAWVFQEFVAALEPDTKPQEELEAARAAMAGLQRLAGASGPLLDATTGQAAKMHVHIGAALPGVDPDAIRAAMRTWLEALQRRVLLDAMTEHAANVRVLRLDAPKADDR